MRALLPECRDDVPVGVFGQGVTRQVRVLQLGDSGHALPPVGLLPDTRGEDRLGRARSARRQFQKQVARNPRVMTSRAGRGHLRRRAARWPWTSPGSVPTPGRLEAGQQGAEDFPCLGGHRATRLLAWRGGRVRRPVLGELEHLGEDAAVRAVDQRLAVLQGRACRCERPARRSGRPGGRRQVSRPIRCSGRARVMAALPRTGRR